MRKHMFDYIEEIIKREFFPYARSIFVDYDKWEFIVVLYDTCGNFLYEENISFTTTLYDLYAKIKKLKRHLESIKYETR